MALVELDSGEHTVSYDSETGEIYQVDGVDRYSATSEQLNRLAAATGIGVQYTIDDPVPITVHSTWPGPVAPGTEVVRAVPVAPRAAPTTVTQPAVVAGPGSAVGFYGDGVAPLVGAPSEVDVDNILGLPAAVSEALRALGLARLTWGVIPGWVKVVLIGLGIAAGTTLLVRRLTGGGGPPAGAGMVPGLVGAQFVGSWRANGVTFYRLADGRIAVQNAKGRWKVWRPKRPIVLMPTGAVNLRTLLRADAVLNRQARKIAGMLNRRGGSRRAARPRALPPSAPTQIVQRGG